MTTNNLSLRVRAPHHNTRKPAPHHGPKYNLIERELTPEEEKALLVAQDERFCAAMRDAIAGEKLRD